MRPRVVVLGAGGQLGRQLTAAFSRAGHDVVALGHRELDIGDPAAGVKVAQLGPDVVVNAAAWTDVDGCARDPAKATAVNGVAPGLLAAAAAAIGARFVQVSTNEVFDGEATEPYREDAAPHPLNPYGAAKLAGERAVAEAAVDHLIVRTAWLFGPGGSNFPSKIVEAAGAAAAREEPLGVVDDEIGNPTWAPMLADTIVQATAKGIRGLLHLAGEPPASRHEWACLVVASLPGVAVRPIRRASYARASTAPARAVLDMARARELGLPALEWREATRRYVSSLTEADR